jgi:hypothetical protein
MMEQVQAQHAADPGIPGAEVVEAAAWAAAVVEGQHEAIPPSRDGRTVDCGARALELDQCRWQFSLGASQGGLNHCSLMLPSVL